MLGTSSIMAGVSCKDQIVHHEWAVNLVCASEDQVPQ